MNGYIKIAEVSKKWGIGERRINTLCLEGRIEGAVKFGNILRMASSVMRVWYCD